VRDDEREIEQDEAEAEEELEREDEMREGGEPWAKYSTGRDPDE
jgi:hypothetical protein